MDCRKGAIRKAHIWAHSQRQNLKGAPGENAHPPQSFKQHQMDMRHIKMNLGFKKLFINGFYVLKEKSKEFKCEGVIKMFLGMQSFKSLTQDPKVFRST